MKFSKSIFTGEMLNRKNTTRHEPLSVFLVDDDRIYLTVLHRKMCEAFRAGVIFHLFNSGEECLKKVHNGPDLVVLDFFYSGVPGSMNGIQILKNIKNRLNDTNVVMLSGHQNIELAAQAVKQGAGDFLVKGENAYRELKEIIRNLLAVRQREKKMSSARWPNFIQSYV